MENIEPGHFYTISTETADEKKLYVTGEFGAATMVPLILPDEYGEKIDPTQAWQVLGSMDKAQLESGTIANTDYRLNFYLTHDSQGNVFSAAGNPNNVVYWVITDAGVEKHVFLELYSHDGHPIGYLELVGNTLKLTGNKQKWTFNKVPG